jgi:hypothetical protein
MLSKKIKNNLKKIWKVEILSLSLSYNQKQIKIMKTLKTNSEIIGMACVILSLIAFIVYNVVVHGIHNI